MIILPLTYLGSTAYYARLLSGDCIVDIHENWVKQTARNRCDIISANGPAQLTVPVHGYGMKIKTKDVRIDNSKKWQHQHWLSLVSAYGNSPYFEHYADRFRPYYERQFEFLLDFNLGLTQTMLSLLGKENVLHISEQYVQAVPSDVDLRGKKSLRPDNETVTVPEYMQVFCDRSGYVPCMSIIDLLLCESAPSAADLLSHCSYRH